MFLSPRAVRDLYLMEKAKNAIQHTDFSKLGPDDPDVFVTILWQEGNAVPQEQAISFKEFEKRCTQLQEKYPKLGLPIIQYNAETTQRLYDYLKENNKQAALKKLSERCWHFRGVLREWEEQFVLNREEAQRVLILPISFLIGSILIGGEQTFYKNLTDKIFIPPLRFLVFATLVPLVIKAILSKLPNEELQDIQAQLKQVDAFINKMGGHNPHHYPTFNASSNIH